MKFTKGQKFEAKIPEFPFKSTEVEIEHIFMSKSGEMMMIYSYKNLQGQFRDTLCSCYDMEWYIRRNK